MVAKTGSLFERIAPTSVEFAKVSVHPAECDGATRQEPIGAVEDRYGAGIQP
jgi:hypothetical protein